MLPPDQQLDDRLTDLTTALRTASKMTCQARHYNRERLAKRANAGTLKPGDSVLIKVTEPITFTSKWQPEWTVTRVRDKVAFLVHQQSGKTKVLNRDKVELVDPNIS